MKIKPLIMAMHESAKHKSFHNEYQSGNANKVPLGTRKGGLQKDKSHIQSHLASPKRLETPAQDTISNSLRQIRNNVSSEKKPNEFQKRASELSASQANGDFLQNKKPSVKDRLGQIPVRGKSNNYREANDYHKNNQNTGRVQRGGQNLFYKGQACARGLKSSPYQKFQGRGGSRGRGGNLSFNQSSNGIKRAFPDSNTDICKAYPIPM